MWVLENWKRSMSVILPEIKWYRFSESSIGIYTCSHPPNPSCLSVTTLKSSPSKEPLQNPDMCLLPPGQTSQVNKEFVVLKGILCKSRRSATPCLSQRARVVLSIRSYCQGLNNEFQWLSSVFSPPVLFMKTAPEYLAWIWTRVTRLCSGW